MDEAQASTNEKVPRPPAYLRGEVRKEWFQIAPVLREAGLLSNLDTRALAGHCVQYAHWRETEDEIRRSGTVILSSKKQPMGELVRAGRPRCLPGVDQDDRVRHDAVCAREALHVLDRFAWRTTILARASIPRIPTA